MKLKIVDIGGKSYAEVQDGKPVIVEEDGKEIPFDIVHTRSTISRLNSEAKTSRERYEANEVKLRSFEGIDDADVARKAIETIKNIEEGKLVAAGKVEEIKASAKSAAEENIASAVKHHTEKLKVAESERDKYRDDLYAEKIGGAFSRSKFISEKASIPADLVQARFGSAFKVEDGKTVAYDAAGQRIYSRERPGENADFEEAIGILVDQYPYRDQILKGTGSTGSGTKPGVNDFGKRVISRTEYDKMPPMQQREVAMKSQIVD